MSVLHERDRGDKRREKLFESVSFLSDVSERNGFLVGGLVEDLWVWRVAGSWSVDSFDLSLTGTELRRKSFENGFCFLLRWTQRLIVFFFFIVLCDDHWVHVDCQWWYDCCRTCVWSSRGLLGCWILFCIGREARRHVKRDWAANSCWWDVWGVV